MKPVIRPGFGYKQESPPPHAYCKIAFVMKTATGQVIADRMKEPIEFILVRVFFSRCTFLFGEAVGSKEGGEEREEEEEGDGTCLGQEGEI